MDMLSAFSAAGYDLHAMALTDFAYGTTRLVSDANMGSGPSLASNLLNNEGTAVFYRSTSWSRNRVTNGRYTVVERAGINRLLCAERPGAGRGHLGVQRGVHHGPRLERHRRRADHRPAECRVRCHPCDCLHRPGGRLAEGPAEPGRDGYY